MQNTKPVPSRMTLMTFNARRVGASKGYELLKKKSDALKKKFRSILQAIVESKIKMGLDYKEALMGMAGAQFAAGDFNRQVLGQVKNKTPVRLTVHSENIAGVHVPIFNLMGEDVQNEDSALLGLSGGGQAINTAREKFTKFLKVLITIATLQTQFVTLDTALKMTNRRVNALEFVIIPRINETISYIKQELDEIDREDFVRLKKTQDKKKEKKAEEAAMHAAAANKGKDVAVDNETGEPADADVIPAGGTFDDDDEDDEDIFV